jgi:transcriptional regulator
LYTPEHFKQDQIPILHDMIQMTGFCSLVTFGSDGLRASHVPILLDTESGPYGKIYGHLAKANQQWVEADPNVDALVIFTGPDAYISPSWYQTKKTTGKVVPTWNYVAVHAYGKLEIFHDSQRLLSLVTKLTERHESESETPWSVKDAPQAYIQGLLSAIVGFEISILRLEGKWKMSQNQPTENRSGVIEGLRKQNKNSVADIMADQSTFPTQT